MALRFRRSFRVAPGIRVNFSGSGASLSVGPRGASATLGSRGTFFNAGIPGTGLSSRSRIGTPARPAADPPNPGRVSVRVTVAVEDDGTIKFLDADGTPLSPEWVERAKRQMGDKIRNLIERCCDEINAKVEALGTIHLQTPAPHERLRYEPREFDQVAPTPPAMKRHGFLGWLFKSTRTRIDADNAERQARFEGAMKDWNSAKAAFDESEQARKVLLEERVLSDVDAMEQVLEGALKAITWPRETIVSTEISESGRVLQLDVDLPEIEDMPRTTASTPSKGYKLTVKEMSAAKLQKLYMQHVHGIGFRIIGEAFAVLPKIEEVLLSAFSQRPNKATGAAVDEYLYSVRVKRDDWSAISFANLKARDVVTALERFELRRQMSKTGAFTPVEPLSMGSMAIVRVQTEMAANDKPGVA